MTDAPSKLPALAPPPGTKPSPSNKDDEIIERRSLRDYYIILRERLWIALPLALTAAIGLFYYQSKETPLYRSSATLQFDQASDRTLNNTPEVHQIAPSNTILLNTYLILIKSEQVRNLVLKEITPEQQKILLRPYPPGAALPLSSALGSLTVQPSRDTLIIDISVTHRDPEAARILADLYVAQFIQYIRNDANLRTGGAGTFLQTKTEELLAKSTAADRKLQDFMRDNKLTSTDPNTSVVSARLLTVSSTLQGIHLERLAIEEQLKLVERYQAEKRDLLEISSIAAYGTIRDLRGQRDGLIRDQTLLAERYLERHPRMIANATAIAVVQEQLDAAIQLAIADLRTSLEKVRANEHAVQEEYTLREQELFHLRDVGVECKSLADQANSARNEYNEINKRRSEVDIGHSLENIPIHALDPAHTPATPFTPDLPRITKTSIGVFFLVFFGIAVGLSFVDDRIKSTWDVETFINATLLGIIPDLGGVKDDEKYRLVLGDSQGAGVEPFLGLYSAVKIHSKLDFPKSLLVTSTVPGEGKTLVSCNLAGSFARHGRSTLLIDCDLRRPMLHRHFNKDNASGLIAWFENGASLDGDLLANPHLGITSIGENISLISAGGRSKSPTQFLESAAFAQLIERLKKHFDLIVIDSPPMGAVTDALLIAERADEIVYVCRFNRAYRKHIRLYIKALRSGKNEILGIVLNGLSPRRIEYYSNYRYYRSYKKYYGAQS